MLEVIHGKVPSKSNSYRITSRGKFPRLYKTQELKDYERSFALQIQHHKGLKIATRFKLVLSVYYPSRRSDLDNSLKIVLDSLQMAQAVVNDRACVEIHATRHIDKQNPRIEFELTAMEDEKT